VDLRGAYLQKVNLGYYTVAEMAPHVKDPDHWFDRSKHSPDESLWEHHTNIKGHRLFGGHFRDDFVHMDLGVDLEGADFGGSDLRGANLGKADLRKASFSGADLRGADISGAHLREADLRGAHLREADLGSAWCGGTIFGDVDLSEVKGLESIRHFGPSTVGVDTLIRFRKKIPEAFLRGCGVPQTLIKNLPSLTSEMEPIQFYSCFISYSTKDEDFAKRLHSRMVQEGLNVWFALKDIRGGQTIDEQVDKAIRDRDKLLLVLSEASLGSDWVKTEILKALEAEAKEGRRKLFPIRLMDFKVIEDWKYITSSGKDLGEEIRRFFIPDFTKWKNRSEFEVAFGLVIDALKAPASTGKGTKVRVRKGRPKRS
jgi:uncharacterized protein YjbI with pentapeptide repeats